MEEELRGVRALFRGRLLPALYVPIMLMMRTKGCSSYGVTKYLVACENMNENVKDAIQRKPKDVTPKGH